MGPQADLIGQESRKVDLPFGKTAQHVADKQGLDIPGFEVGLPDSLQRRLGEQFFDVQLGGAEFGHPHSHDGHFSHACSFISRCRQSGCAERAVKPSTSRLTAVFVVGLG